MVSPDLSERGSAGGGPGAVGLIGADYGTVDADEDDRWDGLWLYSFGDSDPAGTWRAIFMASDVAGYRSPAWRTHDAVRMLTANGGLGKGSGMYIFRYQPTVPEYFTGHAACGATGSQGWGKGTWVYGWYPEPRVAWAVPATMIVAWIAPTEGNDPLLQNVEHKYNVKGYEIDCAQACADEVRRLSEGRSDYYRWLSQQGLDKLAELPTTQDMGQSWYYELNASDNMTNLLWSINGNGRDTFNCSQFAGANTRRADIYDALTPLTLDLHVMSRHEDGDDGFRFLRGRYADCGETKSHDCYWCRNATRRWTGKYYWDAN